MKIKKLEHLSSIFHEYDAFIIDLWGVMHNGVTLNNSAVKAVSELQSNGKRIVFLSNAPRPSKNVIEYLKKMRMEDRFLKNVLTSGEAAINSLKKNKFGKTYTGNNPIQAKKMLKDLIVDIERGLISNKSLTHYIKNEISTKKAASQILEKIREC